MKKWITLLLVFAITLGLCACGGNGEKKTEGLQVGYAKVNITPSSPIKLVGYGDQNTRISQGLVTYIYATCIAVTEGDDTVLLYTLDLLSLNEENAQLLRDAIIAEVDVPADHIFFGATHTHSGPFITDYMDSFTELVVEAAKKAMEDRSPATIQAATHDFEKMNFNRHYVRDDGTYLSNSEADTYKDRLVGHPMETDPQMILVQFDRGEDKKDVLLVNWQAHPDTSTQQGYYNIGASFIGPLRDKLEVLSGMNVAYFTGAGGNLCIDSKISSEAHRLDWKAYGEKLADLASTMLPELKPVEGSGIQTSNFTMDLEVDHSMDDKVDLAREVAKLFKEKGRDVSEPLAIKYGFNDTYHARKVVEKFNLSKTAPRELNAFRIGGIGFTTGTYEMFSDSAVDLKERSPFDITFVISGNTGYIPSTIGMSFPNYEQGSTYYVQGTAEKLVDKYVEMLGTVK